MWKQEIELGYLPDYCSHDFKTLPKLSPPGISACQWAGERTLPIMSAIGISSSVPLAGTPMHTSVPVLLRYSAAWLNGSDWSEKLIDFW